MENVGRSLLVKCTNISQLSPKPYAGPCFILIGLILKDQKGWRGWINMEKDGLVSTPVSGLA